MKWASPIPRAALDMHCAILATSGAGKTVVAKGAVEDLLSEQQRVCIIDPTGVWYGLRTLANGRKGYPVAIFGGKHADVPLDPAAGAALARLIARENLPAIIDTLTMTVGERSRLFADFAEALMRENDEPLHLVVDEAHQFMPQGRTLDVQAGRMLHAGNNLVAGGRARGISVVLISQRASKLHKDALTQCQTLVAMQNVHKLDRDTVVDFVAGYAGKKQADEIEATLARLQTGEGWVYAPKLEVLKRVRFPMIRTLDTSDRPKAGEVRPPPASLDKLDLSAIRQALAEPARHAEEAPDGAPNGKLRTRSKSGEKSYSEADLHAFGRERFHAGRRAERAAVRRMLLQAIDRAAEADVEDAPLSSLAERMLAAIEATPSRSMSVSDLSEALGVAAGDGRWFRAIGQLVRSGAASRSGEVVKLIAGRKQ